MSEIYCEAQVGGMECGRPVSKQGRQCPLHDPGAYFHKQDILEAIGEPEIKNRSPQQLSDLVNLVDRTASRNQLRGEILDSLGLIEVDDELGWAHND